MKQVGRVFWAVGLLLMLPFVFQQGFRVNATHREMAPTLHSITAETTGVESERPQSAVYATYQQDAPRAFQPSAFALHQPFASSRNLLGRLSVPAIGIDLPVVGDKGQPGTEHVEVINSVKDLNSQHHIGLATCFEGDAGTLARRIAGEWIFLQTPHRLRQYRVFDARITDPDALPLSFNLDIPGITLVGCINGYEANGRLLMITAIETHSNYDSSTAFTTHRYSQLKF